MRIFTTLFYLNRLLIKVRCRRAPKPVGFEHFRVYLIMEPNYVSITRVVSPLPFSTHEVAVLLVGARRLRRDSFGS